LPPESNLALRRSTYPRPLSAGAVTSFATVVGAIVLAIGAAGPNFDLAAAAAAALIFGAALLWRPGEPPTLLLIFGFQWLQASLAILQATLAGQTVDELYGHTGPVGEATFLTLAALAALAVGMRVAAGRVNPELSHQGRSQPARGSTQKLFVLYLTFWLISLASRVGMQAVPSLAQVFLGIDNMRWAFFFILGVAHFEAGKRAGWWFPIAFIVEFGLSLGGFFSSFKTVFFVTFLAAMMASVKISLPRIALAGLVGLAAIGMGVVWTAIKPEYRKFASGGELTQSVNVSYPEQIAKLAELTANLDEAALEAATEDFMSRIAYVEFFGSTIAHVPEFVPHEGGALLIDAITRPFMPRAFFPEKTEINDSERTSYYTGRQVSGVETGTSISIGWVAEAYVDFGRLGMHLAALVIGAGFGLVYRFFTNWPRAKGALGFGLATAILLPAAFLETSITKSVGGVVAGVIAAFLIARFVIPLVSPWMAGRKNRGRRAAA
jgi:hypothetical protein